ncbi:putative GntR-family transcriptional regulator [Streptomyces lincolnensis]|uniref:Putative GntR-family transcriptional regulator n=1 Tax=Streptomyces lincolnensis TaxID=1915 RepID=A0A1B1M3X3_STRLN|nr:PLP-dependent aminotransferase family protein [Streptomyces lincolnensis]ANS63345.1 putative GntR-family transcriptional regulator [Streptomyces lincolnensis]QMV05238.1 aminotransferase class I/II-fold pyridoxal phosphate-dependent enzyme [Streptomyces lincolnensis]
MDVMGRSTKSPYEGSKNPSPTSPGSVVRGPDGEPSLGSDFLQLDIGQAPPGGRTAWLADRLRSAIADGRLPVGARLPASRVLAEELRVTRGVVTEAYRRLAESGQIAGRGRLGTVVVAAPAAPRDRTRAAGEPGPALFGSADRDGVIDALRSLPCRIDLSPGVPDLAAFPRTAWLRAERSVLAGVTPADFGYGDPRGAPALRRAVVGWLARNRGIRADPDEVVVVAGVAQAFALLGQLLRADGVLRVAVEDPGSLGARQQLEYGGHSVVPVPVDDGGLDVGALRASGARAVLLTPAHQFPTGVVLDGERRRELLRWAAEGGLVIEDDYDAEHRYDRPPVLALRSLMPDGVCYAGSVSKLLAPALRVGWLLVPPNRLEAAVTAKRYADLGNGILTQLVLARLMDTGELERHLRHVRLRHRRRRDVMLRAIEAHLPGARVHGAAAGLHLMVTFDGRRGSGLRDTDLAAAALAQGVKVHPLSWHRISPGAPGLVLGYAAGPAHEIEEGITLVGDALRGLRAGSPR